MWDTSIESMRFGIAGYIVPFMLVYGTSLLVGQAPWPETVLALATGTIGTLCLAGAVIGRLLRATTILDRVLLLAASLLLIKPGWTTDLIGLALLGTVLILQTVWRPRLLRPAQP